MKGQRVSDKEFVILAALASVRGDSRISELRSTIEHFFGEGALTKASAPEFLKKLRDKGQVDYRDDPEFPWRALYWITTEGHVRFREVLAFYEQRTIGGQEALAHASRRRKA